MQTITDKDVQAVTESFNALIKELNRVNDDIKQVIADLAMEGKLDKVTESTASATVLTNFTQEVANLSTRWNKGIFGQKATKRQSVVRESKEPVAKITSRSKIMVTFLNTGKKVFHNKSSQTFAETLEKMNLDKVEKLNKIVSNFPLISKQKSNSYHSQELCAGWYVNTHLSNKDKKILLDEISAELKIPIRVETV